MKKIPFGEFIENESIPEGTLYIINPRYKTVQVNQGEPPILKEVLDIEATARASLIVKNIGTGKEST
jgi:hypothetical protein